MFAEKVNILGTDYKIILKKDTEDKKLEKLDGYCDKTTKELVVCDIQKNDMTVGDLNSLMKETLRHEILHAFLDESGLQSSSLNYSGAWAVNEEMVDWFAIQFPKIYKAFVESGAF